MNRVKAMFQYRSSMGDFGNTFFGERACLHCFLKCDTIVLDSEWHWVFDCVLFDELRHNLPSFFMTLRSIRGDRGFSEESDLGFLLNATISDSRIGFSLASFVRQATSLRESWLKEECVRGRLCIPPDHWHRNLIRFPPSAAEFPPDFENSFTDGKPWFLDQDILGF